MKRVMVNIAEDLSEEEFCREFWASLDDTVGSGHLEHLGTEGVRDGHQRRGPEHSS